MKLVVLISGTGSNLLKVLEACASQFIAGEVVAVISNKSSAKGLDFAQQFNVPAHVLEQSDFESREAHDQAIADQIASYQPDYIVLAGYMRILTEQFIARFDNQIINIHPSLLPLYKGLNTHQRAIDDGQNQAGCTVHLVTPELDSGQILAQAIVPVLSDDQAESLAKRVQKAEHLLYPQVLRWLGEGELSIHPQLTFQQKTLPASGLQLTQEALEVAQAKINSARTH